MVRQMIKALVWDEGAADYFEAGPEGTEKTTLEELRDGSHMKGKAKEELEEIYAESELLILEADCERLGALKWLTLMKDGEITGFEGYTEDDLRDCVFMDGMGREELECLLARAEGTIREAASQRFSARKRLALVS